MSKIINPFNIKRLMIILLVLAILPIDTGTGFYYFLRFYIFIAGIYLMVKDKEYPEIGHKLLYIAMMVLWNPFDIFFFDKMTWIFFDLLAAVFLFVNRLSVEERGKFFKF